MLLAREALGRISQARNDLVEHIREQGDGPIKHLLFPFDTVEIRIKTLAGAPLPTLTYNHTAAILGACLVKKESRGLF